MKRFFSELYNSSPKQMVWLLKTKFLGISPHPQVPDEEKAKEIAEKLQEKFKAYQVANLKSITPTEFEYHINSKIGVVDAEAEGYSGDELALQRDLSIKFCWGHDHDFGDFKIKGMMGNRHFNILINFMSLFSLSTNDFKGKDVFDIGCWTGGTTLLMALLARNVFSIEEVKKYAEMTSFLVDSFGINDRVSVDAISIYDCNSEDFYDRFDIVYFPGVIYHLSDPVLALRILFNALKKDGFILIESMGIDVSEPYCVFRGNKSVQKDDKAGWAWFWLSPSALSRMMKEAGFSDVQVIWREGKVYGYGKKVSQVGMCKAGLSVRTIR